MYSYNTKHKLNTNNHYFFPCWQSSAADRLYFFYLGGHDELVVDDVVGGVAHTKQGAGGMEVTWHACPHVHIFTDALGANTGINNKLNVQLRMSG